MVEDVIKFEPKLKAGTLRQLGIFGQHGISFSKTWIAEIVVDFISFNAQGRFGEDIGVGAGEEAIQIIVPAARQLVTGNIGKIEVHAVTVVVTSLSEGCIGKDVKRIAVLNNGGPADSPSADNSAN